MVVPEFATEAEEADWWFEHQDLLLQEFKLAGAEGRLGRGRTLRRAQVAASAIHLDPEDIVTAQNLAAKHGLEYQTYVKTLLHEALAKEVKAA